MTAVPIGAPPIGPTNPLPKVPAYWDVQFRDTQIGYDAPSTQSGLRFPEVIWYIFKKYYHGTKVIANKDDKTSNKLPARGQILWDRSVWLSAVLQNGRDALVVLGPHKSTVGGAYYPPTWKLQQLDFLYRQFYGIGGLLFTGGGYYERILWAISNNLMTPADVKRSIPLQEVVNYNEEESGWGRWAQWVLLEIQRGNNGVVMDAIYDKYTSLLDESIGIVQPDGSIVYNKLLPAKKIDNPGKKPKDLPPGLKELFELFNRISENSGTLLAAVVVIAGLSLIDRT